MRRLPRLGLYLTMIAACATACAGEQERVDEDEAEETESDASTGTVGDDDDGDDDDDDVDGDPAPRDAAARDAAREPLADAGAAPSSGRDAQVLDASMEAGSSRPRESDATVPKPDGGGEAGAPAVRDAAAADAGAFARAFHIPLRVHRGKSALTGTALASILEEVNEIWWKQAAICFEIEIVRGDEVRRDGFDFWFHQSGLGCGADANGVYCGDHDIHSLDAPSLNPADNRQWDTRQNPARTTAHELGHGLNLQHYNGYPDSNDSLMSSGRQGFKLHEMEIATARRRAEAKALPDSSASPCAAVPVVN